MKKLVKDFLYILFFKLRRKVIIKNDLSGKNLNKLDTLLLNTHNIKTNLVAKNDVSYDSASIWQSESGDNFWKCDAHYMTAEDYQSDKIYRTPFLNEILNIIKKNNVEMVVELGCGRGDNLLFLKQKFNGCSYFGLDANEEVIEIAKSMYGGISFECASIHQFFEDKKLLHSNTLIFFASVLMYFNAHNISQLLKKLPKNIIVGVNEPFDERVVEADESFTHSLHSFYHNYEKLLDDAGFSVLHKSVRKTHNKVKIISLIYVKG